MSRSCEPSGACPSRTRRSQRGAPSLDRATPRDCAVGARGPATIDLDEVLLEIKGKRHWPWRAVDRQGVILDIRAQQRRDQHAAETFLRRVLAAAGFEPRVVITDKLASYLPALPPVLPTTEHRRHKGLNNQAENSHQPTRQRERVMGRSKSPEQAQRFLGPFGAISDHFRTGRYRNPAPSGRQMLTDRSRTWREVVVAHDGQH